MEIFGDAGDGWEIDLCCEGREESSHRCRKDDEFLFPIGEAGVVVLGRDSLEFIGWDDLVLCFRGDLFPFVGLGDLTAILRALVLSLSVF